MSGTLAQRYHGWDNRVKQRLEKSGLKVNKKGERTRAQYGYHSWDNMAKQRLDKSGLKVNKKGERPM